jgi:soluble lytic murein transglycosylase-like protein
VRAPFYVAVACILALLWYLFRRGTCRWCGVPVKLFPGERFSYEGPIRHAAAKYGIDWTLLAAHVQIESSGNAFAQSGRNCLGLGQILCIPDAQGFCTNKFPAVPQWEGMHRESLFIPAINLDIAAAIIASNIRMYGMPRAVAVYNSWIDHKSPINGPWKGKGTNAYVSKVFAQQRVYQALDPAPDASGVPGNAG